MNQSVSYANLSWAQCAHAGWQARVVARKGDGAAEVAFATPTGGELRHQVSIDRLGRALRAKLDTVAPIRRAVKMRMRFN
ncbi:MAG: hypothetical protein Q7S34_00535 [bacterium]|nr:hypothetical protein [bacterium]